MRGSVLPGAGDILEGGEPKLMSGFMVLSCVEFIVDVDVQSCDCESSMDKLFILCIPTGFTRRLNSVRGVG